MKQHEFALYHDAIKGRSTELLSKVFDNVRVLVELEPGGCAVRVTAQCMHRGRSYGYAQVFSIYMLNPQDYAGYLRNQLPTDFAREIIDYIIRS